MRLTTDGAEYPKTLGAKLKNGHGAGIAMLVAVALMGIAWLDRVTNELPVHYLYYLPIILAAVRFRHTGGSLAAGLAVLLYYLANPNRLGRQYTESELMLLAIFFGVSWVTVRLIDDAEQMRRLAHTDDLTGLHNLRSFEVCYVMRCDEAIKQRVPLTLIVLDLDRLKSLNDRYGHLAGAQAIQALGRVIKQHLPSGAIACRYGGDEFVIALSSCTIQEGLETAQQICLSIASLPPLLSGHALSAGTLTVSVGAATLVPMSAEDPGEFGEALFHAADQALYRAKDQGRNRVCGNFSTTIVGGGERGTGLR